MKKTKTYRVICRKDNGKPVGEVSYEQKKNISRALKAHGMSIKDENRSDSSSSDSDSDESTESTGNRLLVPLKILIDFLRSIKMEDWEEAQKLCKIILLYEPYNPQILRFVPLIQKRVTLERQFEEISECDSCYGSGCGCPVLQCEDDSDEEELEKAEYEKLKKIHMKEKLLFSEKGDDESLIWAI